MNEEQGDGVAGGVHRDRRSSAGAVLALAAVLAIGCGGGGGGGPTGPEPPPGTVEGNTARLDGLSVTLLVFEPAWQDPSGLPQEPDAGFRFATAEVRYTNATSSSHLYDSGEFELRTSPTQVWGPDPGWRTPALDTDTLGPGQSAQGWITFQVPVGSAVTHLVWEPRTGIRLEIPVNP